MKIATWKSRITYMQWISGIPIAAPLHFAIVRCITVAPTLPDSSALQSVRVIRTTLNPIIPQKPLVTCSGSPTERIFLNLLVRGILKAWLATHTHRTMLCKNISTYFVYLLLEVFYSNWRIYAPGCAKKTKQACHKHKPRRPWPSARIRARWNA